MDKQDATIRNHLAERADLIAAIRLPNTTFKANAGNGSHATDILLFAETRDWRVRERRNLAGALAPIETPDGPVSINEYFVRHPETMLGTMRLERAGSTARVSRHSLGNSHRNASLPPLNHFQQIFIPVPRNALPLARSRSQRVPQSKPSRTVPLPSATAPLWFAAARDSRHSIFRNPSQRACAECLWSETPFGSSFRLSSTTSPKIALQKPASCSTAPTTILCGGMGLYRQRKRQEPSRAIPITRCSSRSKPTIQKPNALPRPPSSSAAPSNATAPSSMSRQQPRPSPFHSTKPARSTGRVWNR